MAGRRLFGTNGIRGVVNRELTPEFVMKVGRAVGIFFEGGRILVGYDGRTSGPMFTQAAVAHLTLTGCTVYDAGLVPTPVIQYAVKRHRKEMTIDTIDRVKIWFPDKSSILIMSSGTEPIW